MADLSELFARDPLTLTRENIDAIIAHLRESRSNFQIGDKRAGKAPVDKANIPALNLSALGLVKK